MSEHGRNATRPYRVRAGATWYWVDPTAPESAIEPGDVVVIYAPSGEAHLAVLQQHADARGTVAFTDLDGARFALARHDIAALHLAIVDSVQR